MSTPQYVGGFDQSPEGRLNRFLAHVQFEPNSGCWLWTANCVRGYGHFSVQGRSRKAHRFSYETLVGPIPEGMQIDHKCRTKLCVNPVHLEPVTGMVNTDRAPRHPKNRTHCPAGHAYEGDNLYFTKRGARVCRKCNVAYQKKHEAKLRAMGLKRVGNRYVPA